jgi:hypothetical protein
VTETVTPVINFPLVTYRAPLGVGTAALVIGIPRELKMMQAVFVIGVPESSRQLGAWLNEACVLEGGVVREPKPKDTPVERD